MLYCRCELYIDFHLRIGTYFILYDCIANMNIMSESGVIDLIHMIREKERIQANEIRKFGNYNRLLNLLDELILKDIVKKDVVKKPYEIHYYSLTERGVRVADKISELNQIANQ